MGNLVRSQVEQKQKRKKCPIQRHNAVDISIRNARYEASDRSFSHIMGRRLVDEICSFSYVQKRMLSRLLAKIIYNNGVTVARTYFCKMVGMGAKTISNYIKLFESIDLIRVDQYFEAPNDFRIGPAALNEIIRNYLLPHLPVLRLLLRLPLVMLSSQVHASEFPLLYKKDFNNTLALAQKKRNSNNGKACTYEQLLAQHAPMLRYIATQFPSKEPFMIETLELTDAGRINLSIFPKEAITFADAKLKLALQKGATVANPFQFLCKVAHSWCEEHHIRPNYRSMFQQLEQKGFDDNSRRFNSILISSNKNNFKSKPKTTNNTEKETSNPIPNIDLPGACCYFNTLDHEEQCRYIKRQMGAYRLDADGNPTTISPHYKNKLICQH